MFGSLEAWRSELTNPWGTPRGTPDGRKHVEIETKGFRVDLTDARWQKSTKCDNSGPNCVEVAFVGGAIALRDSKDPTGPALIFTGAEWDAFVAGAKDGEFDL